MARSGGAAVGGASVIKSVQRGTISAAMGGGNTGNATISTVDINKCAVQVAGGQTSGSGYQPVYVYSFTATQLRVDVVGTYSGSSGLVSWEVVEYV